MFLYPKNFFSIKTPEITLLVLMPGIITMDAQGAYDLAHVLIESANKLQRKNALTITFGKDS